MKGYRFSHTIHNFPFTVGWDSIHKEGSIPLDQEDFQPLKEVLDSLALVLPRGPGQLLYLEDSLDMPAT